ncbi:MAG TPA: hypothetical protein VGE84_09995, partial [Allosphingosinicella sp.]
MPRRSLSPAISNRAGLARGRGNDRRHSSNLVSGIVCPVVGRSSEKSPCSGPHTLSVQASQRALARIGI